MYVSGTSATAVIIYRNGTVRSRRNQCAEIKRLCFTDAYFFLDNQRDPNRRIKTAIVAIYRWIDIIGRWVCSRFAHPGYAQGRADIYILFGRTADIQVKLLRVIGMVIYFKFAANAFLIDGICIRHFHHYVLFRIFQRIMYYSRHSVGNAPAYRCNTAVRR